VPLPVELYPSIAATPHSASTSSKTSAAFGGRNAKGRTTRPLFSEYPASSLLRREFTFTLQIAQPIEIMVVQLVKTWNGDIEMAKKQKVNKTQAVRDYLKAHPKAMSGEIAAALTKQGIKINAGHVANIKSQINKARTTKKAAKKQAAVEAATPVVVETTKAAATVTLEHVKAVALTVKTLGGPVRLYELLGLIKEVGGVKKFKDLLDAMSVPEADDIPF
jgi:hypothetical protein